MYNSGQYVNSEYKNSKYNIKIVYIDNEWLM